MPSNYLVYLIENNNFTCLILFFYRQNKAENNYKR